MIKVLTFIFVFGLCFFQLNAQFSQTYTPLKSSGKLPKDFVERSSEKYRAAKNETEQKTSKESNEIKDRFLLATNFEIDNILLSGKVLFNDPISNYISKVADKILENDKETRGKLRFYLLQSTAVNAFSTNQGIIVITTGMLAQIENEAQLAFVLCHEISHFKEKHSMKKFEENENIEDGKGEYKRLSASEKRIAGYGFSKEQEEEADKKGLELFLKTSYSTSTILGVFDVLKYSHLPFDEVEFPISFFENENLKFPSSYKLEKTKEINTKDNEEDDEEDHPALPKRRDYMLKKLKLSR